MIRIVFNNNRVTSYNMTTTKYHTPLSVQTEVDQF